METYIALLRGVNVGQNLLKMERLREICTGLGFKNVRTYVQSGNLVFEAGRSANFRQSLEKKLIGESRLPVTVLLRTPEELKSVIARNPFLKAEGIDVSRLHVTFLSEPASEEGIKKLSAIKAGADRFRAVGTEIYLDCPNGYGTSKLSNSAIEKTLGQRATTRNWNSVNKLYEVATASSG